ncbi:unnamed protein product [Oppiella nova]|uniref:T-cell immunomodulatory protein TIP C2 domain-containing protein n=1 Tax=Oppiella nova TaxID=334625 RepID=A0A7R9QFN0_9ACAR|nr:unnamed protein product [Oppiella nova]CAG2164058.1 unnamed protein product [Oppiella nova]
MEYWHNDKGFAKLEMVTHSYPPNKYKHLGQSAFVDINTDGLIDHILAVCSNELNSNDNECKDPQILGYHLDDKQWIPISDMNIGNQSALTFAEVSVFGQKLPITLKHGDIDGDGYPDLITVMKDNKNQLKAVVLKNTKADNKLNRKFVVDWTSDKALGTEVNVEIAAFVDLFEDGKIDILMTTIDKSGKRSVEAVLNTEWWPLLVTSGLCYGSNCPRGNIPYGTNQAGPFVCYQLQDLDGNMQTGCAGQLSQSSHFALQMPYSVFGLGETPNFLQDLDGNMQTGCAGQLSQSSHFALQMPYSVFGLGETPNFVKTITASIPSGAMKPRDTKWTQIVSDAQVALIPFPPNDTSSWREFIYA